MANENTDRSELDKLLRKRKLSIDNVDKEIFPLVDHFIAKERLEDLKSIAKLYWKQY